MDNRTREFFASGLTVAIFLAVQLGALALVKPFKTAGYQTVSDPSDPTNSLVYIGVILVFTAGMLVVIKLGVQWILRAVIILTSGMISLYVFSVVIPAVVTVTVADSQVNVLAWVFAALVSLALAVYPEWYVIDAAGVLMGAGSAGLFGISFGLLPAILLLAVLAVYDAISVYGTEHMLTLASGVMDLKIPVILVIPLSLSYSFLEDTVQATSEGAVSENDDELVGDGDGEFDDPESLGDAVGDEREPNRDAFFIGLGDAVMPTVMVASAAFFSPANALLSGIALNLPALTAMIGTIAGLLVLLWMVMKGRAHAGLPLLNGGAIGGYLVGALASGIPLMKALGL
ncbi:MULTISPECIES: presenilin family intramembrane aspartyl protease PSH [unclassified Haladaptatus]|uniref:presenilin family intramembrane aspartyl protease PSH n=1 Tax=unclassified Haladaptatus TaxID=2622732 RepID=UPI00209C1CAA|nr:MULTISPECIES: presenilin family intramembrane aspartyl protease PSH [unclassified Haladaptatus]MCO8245996.1 presenilin family intramembrane aspartyl protease [Haladaptatus sp. AB643]MCO8254384.1 presenilin family intramembrane aspartyl protease [Haladaptatus sp. AB618]